MFGILLMGADTTQHAQYWTGVVGQQVMQIPFVFQDLNFCITSRRHSSPLNSYANQLCCIKQYLSHCLLKSTPRSANATAIMSSFSQTYCGLFSFNEYRIHSSDMALFIEIIKGHILHHQVMKFNFKIRRASICGDHGLVFYSEGFRSDSYCGRRVPWTLIIPADKSYMHMAIKSYLDYEISIFYSSFQHNWIRRFIDVKLLQPQNSVFKFNRKNIDSVECYILADHNKLMYLNIFSTGPLNGSVIIKDGPGHLSNTILELSNTRVSVNVNATTSAYWAFVKMILPQKTYTVIKIRVKVDSILDKSPACFRQSNVYIPETSIYGRNIVCSNPIWATDYRLFLTFNVKNFVFHGANKLTHISSSSCEYGGLRVNFYANDKGFELCQDTKDVQIGSQSDVLYITLVWFQGYSRGHFVGNVEIARCRSFYLEIESPDLIYSHDIFIKMKTYPNCYYVVCPPVHIDIQQLCTIQLGPPSVGTTSFTILTQDTLEPCEINLINEYSKQQILYTINVVFTENWPFGLNNSTIKSHGRYSMQNKYHKYSFLHSATVELMLLCSQNLLLKQMAVLVGISECQKIDNKYFNFIANSIASLTDSCTQLMYTFTALKQDIYSEDNYNDFIYKNFEAISTGHEVLVEYTSCPTECRIFNYSVFVVTEDSNTIIEYTTQVGHTIYTGHYHRGFRVTIFIPENKCVFAQVCQMVLTFFRPQHTIGGKDYDIGLFKFYNER